MQYGPSQNRTQTEFINLFQMAESLLPPEVLSNTGKDEDLIYLNLCARGISYQQCEECGWFYDSAKTGTKNAKNEGFYCNNCFGK